MSALARRYAQALFGTGPDENTLRGTAAALMSAPRLWEVLQSPAVTPAEKKAVLVRLPGLSKAPELLRFLGLLAEKGRMALLPGIVEEFHRLCLEERGGTACVMTCVRPPEGEQRERIRETLCRLHSKAEVELTIRNDPALLGGFTLEIEGVTYDWSVRGRLRELSRHLEEGNTI